MPVKTIAMKKLKGTKRTFYCDDGCLHKDVDFYPADLVEKIITDLSNQVLEGRRKWNSLFFRSQLRRRKLWDKRAAAIAEVGNLKADYKEACDRLQTANLIKDEQKEKADKLLSCLRCLVMRDLIKDCPEKDSAVEIVKGYNL